MEHDAHTYRPGAVTAVDAISVDASAGERVGKRTHTEALEPAMASTAGVGRGAGASEDAAPPVAATPRTSGALPRLDLRSTLPAATVASEHEGQGAGWGVDTLLSGIKTVARTAKDVVSSVVSALHVPKVTHETTNTAPNAGNNRTTVGVGEYVTFTSNMPGRWKADRAALHCPKKMRGEFFMWGAMSTAGTAKITFTPDDRSKPPVEITMTVIAPEVDYLNPRPRSFPGEAPGIAGVMMETDVTFGPGTVSFAGTDWFEKRNPATSPTGYFQDLLDKGKKLPYHRPNPKPMGIDENNSGVPDEAGFWNFAAPYSAGSFEWVIPTYYRVRETGQKYKLGNVVQTCTIGPDGTMTVSKGSSRHSRRP